MERGGISDVMPPMIEGAVKRSCNIAKYMTSQRMQSTCSEFSRPDCQTTGPILHAMFLCRLDARWTYLHGR